MERSGINMRLLLMLGIIGFSVIKYYMGSSINPVTGEKQRVSLTPEQEVAMGLQSAPQMAAEFGGLYNDPKVQNAIKTIGNKLVRSTEAAKSPYQFDFHVLADPETVNAFALPGGQIFITVGLLKRLENEHQIAGVLGHEIGHVVNRHSAEHMAKQGLLQGIVQGVVVGASDGSGMGTAQIAQYVGSMINMKFGRDDELESDKYGLHYMYESGYQPEQMIRVMQILDEASGGQRQSEFASSHPSPENRIIKIKEEIAKIKGQ
ncbi:MAG: M48 family metallopeptidase [Saprospiraceae bacterium]|nr:M48 family metallopeptidase [Saprospiraceae bacterium]